MTRTLVLVIFVFAAFALTQRAAADSIDIWHCMKQKTRMAEETGQQPDVRAIRELCIQAAGDSTVVRPVEGGNPEIKKEFCRSYADDASTRAAFAFHRCTYLRGPRYTLNQADHFNWCMAVPARMADSEQAARRTEVNNCILCNRYALDTIDQFKRKERCVRQLSGPHWVPNIEVEHLDWCIKRMASGSGAIDVLNHSWGREKDLKTCHRQYDQNFDPAAQR